MNSRFVARILRVTAGLAAVALMKAEISLPAIFGDHMVLQRTDTVPVWGWAASGENVVIEIAGVSSRTTADIHGRWRTQLDLARVSAGPFEFIATGKNRVVVKDVMIGEVWLASGQSNMEFALHQSIGGREAIEQSANPQLRFFKVARNPAAEPQEKTEGRWVVSDPKTVRSFSAVGFHFGKNLQQALAVPVAVIDTSIGGTQAESWMSAEGIAAIAELPAGRDRLNRDATGYALLLSDYRRTFPDWEKKHRRGDRAAASPDEFAGRDIPLVDWKKVQLPGRFSAMGLPDAGVIWFRKTIRVTPGMAVEGLRIDLGDISEFVEVYWDGKKIGETDYRGNPGLESRFTYMVPKALVKEGDAVLAMRIRNPGGGAALRANPSGSSFRVIRDALNRQFLIGEWLAKAEYALPVLEPAALASMPREPALPPPPKALASSLFNGLTNPILPFGIRGVIWYQGEGNAARAWQYRKTFPGLIDDWRKKWARPDMPFYFCQLANFGPLETQPGPSAWAELREAQAMAAALPNTGMAVLIDIGEEGDIHPRDKTTVGERLARLALAKDYGKSVVWTAPAYRSMSVEGAAVRIYFTPGEEHLVAKPLPETYLPRTTEKVTKPRPRYTATGVQGFVICGEDREWAWADEARIEGATVVVSSAKVPKPVAVRYAWADNPLCNLYGSHGLPVAPFRTDDFPASTRDMRY